MSDLIVRGGKSLCGEVEISGSKNAVLPLIFASLTVDGVTALDNVPDIEDVKCAVEIIRCFGADTHTAGSRLIIDARDVRYTLPPAELVGRIRASSYLIGACLSRFGRAGIYQLGGCNFEPRPIDLHIYAMKSLGARESDGELVADELVGADIAFPKVSVGATINAMISSVSARGVTRIYGYAREPHVISLAAFYRSAGVDIRVGDDFIEIHGTRTHSATARVIPDMIEAGTYIIASLMTESQLCIRSLDVTELQALIRILEGAGISFRLNGRGLIPYGKIKCPLYVKTDTYPGFPTDLQPQTAPLMALFRGGEICETVWLSRFGYLSELARLGVKYERYGHCARVYPSLLRAADVTAPDLRGGAALLLAALAADGESKIRGSEIIDRGYEDIVFKLSSLGADISRRNDNDRKFN